MNKDLQNKDNKESNANSTPSNVQTTVEIEKEHKNKKTEPNTDRNTVILDIEQEPVANTTNVSQNGRRNKYWVMLFGIQPPEKTPPAEQSNWFPWHYIPGCGPPPPPPKPPALAYKPETRNSFVKLVMTIVLIMILATAGFVGFVLMTPDVKDFFRHSGWSIILPALGLLLIVDYGMMCSPCAREPPCNIIFLFLAVVAMSLLSSKITAHYKTEVVLYAIIASAAVVLVCCLLACSSFDFTRWMLFIIVIGTALSVVMIIVLIIKITTGTMMKPVILAILIVSTLFQSILLTIQLQTILGGKSVELSESDYALGAFMVYTSIIDIFLKMVQILGISGNM